MGGQETQLQGPDLTQGVSAKELENGQPLLGHAHGLPVVLVRQGNEFFATGATCSHYGGPLAEGLVEGETIRCPWHHARFDLRSGAAVGAPALNPLPCFQVTREGDRICVGAQQEHRAKPVAGTSAPVVIIGAGAAGSAAAELLRREGYQGSITLVAEESPSPVDRPNLSKDYLAGTAPEEWVHLRGPEFYAELKIDYVAADPATAIDTRQRKAMLKSGRTLPYERLVLATGAEPVRLDIPGANLPHVHTLRSLADSQSIIARAVESKRIVIIGSSFIGLEAAASLRHRGLEVHVVGQEQVPLERVFGAEVGRFIQMLHVDHGVQFHLGLSAKAIHSDRVELTDGTVLPCDLVVMGVGVGPRTSLAKEAGLRVERGIVVNEQLQTSVEGIYAAGDVAQYPDRATGELIRVEHWVAAQRQGQAVARALLGKKEAFHDVPFFWSQHYDVSLSYIGHATQWDRLEIRGSLAERNATVIYRREGRPLAILTLGRDLTSLQAEAALEAGDLSRLEAALA